LLKLRVNSRTLGTALKVVTLLVVVALVYLGYTVWSAQRNVDERAVSSRAIDTLIKQVEADPGNASARVLLGQALAAAGRVDEAVEQLNAALSIDKDQAAALEGLGIIAMRRGEWATAEGYWRRILELTGKGQYASQDLRVERANYYLGLTLIERKQFEEAVLYLKEAVRIKRSSSDTHYALAIAYKELGSRSNQRNELETALRYDPKLPEANYELGLMLAAEGDRAGAAELFRRSLDNAPYRAEPAEELEKFGPFSERMAEAQRLATSDPAAALIEARIAVALEPSDLPASRLVASLLEKVGNKEDAALAWERVLKLAPQDPEALEARERLSK
jgi:Flp pilus assembly protein TadD